MRILIALPLLLLSAPAMAQSHPDSRVPDAKAAAALLSNPLVQDSLAALVTRFGDALLDTRVGPAATLAPDAGIGPDDRLADLAARRDPAYRAHIRDDTRHAVAAAGHALGAAAAMSDELAKTANRLSRVLDGASLDR